MSRRTKELQSKTASASATKELYSALEAAYGHFNDHLFKGSLPEVVFTMHRSVGTLGYFIPDRWASEKKGTKHEISINPIYIGKYRIIDVLETLVHEMVHCWQYCHGHPSRSGYHNKEWAYKMIDVGLQPSSTGQPGGEIVGNQMSHYSLEGGQFLSSATALVNEKSFNWPWIYRVASIKRSPVEQPLSNHAEPNEAPSSYDIPSPATVHTEDRASESPLYLNFSDLVPEGTIIEPVVKPKPSKSKYICNSCSLAVWGKPNLRIGCIDCGVQLEEGNLNNR
ncbi:SprT-like domain-containing protein [Agaribacterium sp. ZY112]|uniref:SprT-like domain-containing protein n=1 Tax=Agaribacterium sp. ZY112 TaxID=3233574 RepID=UPI0035241802